MHVRKLIQGHGHTMDNPSIHRIAIPTVLESCYTLTDWSDILFQGLPGSQGPIGLPGEKVGSVFLT